MARRENKVPQQSAISGVFYNKSYSKSEAIEKRRQFIASNPIPTMEPVRILGYTQVFKVYNKQSVALNYAKENGMGLMVFAYEGLAVGEGGRRNFLVCHPRKLWNNLKNRPLHYRCTYEVIPEYSHCKLYFDLEFSKELNPGLHGEKMVSVFAQIVNSFLIQEFGVTCGSEYILDLESSTDKKFSRHLIFNHPQLYFENYSHVGRFVNEICKYLKQIYNDEVQETKISNISITDIQKLTVKTESSVTLFCDQGVYTKNRNFRILGSTKLGKCSPLVVSSENKYKPHSHTENEDENWFLDSLVTYIPSGAEIVKFESEVTTSHMSSCHSNHSKQDCHVSSSSPCPYPEIQNFINNFLGGENLVRNWRYFNVGELLILDIDKRHRYCNNIGREHKSNSVMYVVNLRLGVFYQKCHDPDCKDFRSNEMKLPLETMPWKCIEDLTPFDKDSGAGDDDDEDDDDLLAAVEQIEEKHKDLIKTPTNNKNNKNSNNDIPSPWCHLSDVKITPIKSAESCEYKNVNNGCDYEDDDIILAAAQEMETDHFHNEPSNATNKRKIEEYGVNGRQSLTPLKFRCAVRGYDLTNNSQSFSLSDEEMLEACNNL